ncbi:MAG: PAS domain S-box protein [Gammaproteobacteria bacterium]|nr:PAS domain S-box protein [Gammaproteobacteria bacterium]
MALTLNERKNITKSAILNENENDSSSSIRGNNVLTELESLPESNISQLVTELNLYQIKLEHQDKDLLKSQLDLDTLPLHHTDLYDFVPVGYFTLSASALIIEVNQSGAKLIGIEKHSLINRPFTQFMPASSEDLFTQHLKHSFQQNTEQSIEIELLKDGIPFHVQIISMPHIDSMRGDPQLLTFVLDITERKKRETYLQQNRRKMASADRITSIGELASIIVHEINQPLAAISNYLHGCIRRLESGNFQTNDLIHALNQAVKQSQRTAEIIQGMKNFSCKGTLNFESVCINSVVKDAGSLSLLDAEAQVVSYCFKPAENNPTVMLDKIHIQQAIFNLVKNALANLKDTTLSNPMLTIELSQPNKATVEVRLIDNGPSLSPETIYQLLHPNYSTKACSIALDLAVSRTIIEAHGGELSACANTGAGNCFKFTLSSQMLRASPAF